MEFNNYKLMQENIEGNPATHQEGLELKEFVITANVKLGAETAQIKNDIECIRVGLEQ